MKTHGIGIIMNGVTGRMGTNQHYLRSILAIREQGGDEKGGGSAFREMIPRVDSVITGADDDHCPPGRVRSRDENVTFGSPKHRGVTGGEEDGVDNTNVDSSKLYTQPEEVSYAYEELKKVTPMCFHPLTTICVLPSFSKTVGELQVENSSRGVRQIMFPFVIS